MSTDYFFKTDDLPALRELGVALGFLQHNPATDRSGVVTEESWSAVPGCAWIENAPVTKPTGKMLKTPDGYEYPERLAVPGIHCNLRIAQTAEYDREQGQLKAKLLREIAIQRATDFPEYAAVIQAALTDFSKFFVLDEEGVPVDPKAPQMVWL